MSRLNLVSDGKQTAVSYKLKMSKNEIKYQSVNVDGTNINFPFEPYDLQIEYMRKVAPYSSKMYLHNSLISILFYILVKPGCIKSKILHDL